MGIKENWLKTDELCPNCGFVTKRQKGLTKQNLKRLITPKFNWNEVLITFMLIMVVVLAFSYKNEIKQCQDWIAPMFAGSTDDCKFVCNNRCDLIKGVENVYAQSSSPKYFNLIMNELNASGNYTR